MSEIASNEGTKHASITLMKLFRNVLLLAALWLCGLAGAQAEQSAPVLAVRPQADRWLLIVDTSSAMKGRVSATQGVLAELLASGMNGQMKPGAELGIWTYNKELYAGVAPKQTWDPASSNLMVNRTLGFLEKQGFHNKAQLAPVVVGMSNAVSVSKRLTIVWVSDGSQKISGTPFDEAINTTVATNKVALAKNHMPLVTVLRVYHREYIGQSVTVAPSPIVFPPFPVEPEKTNVVVKAEAAPAKIAEPGKSIFMSGPNKTADSQLVPAEARSSAIRLRPPPDSETTSAAVAPAMPMAPMQPLPLAEVAPTTPVAAPTVVPVEPAPVAKNSAPTNEPKGVQVAATTPPPAAPPANPPTTAPVPTAATAAPKISPPTAATVTPPVPASQDSGAMTGTITARKWPLILGIGFMWAAIMVALVLARRARRANASSLITRSLSQGQR